MNEQQLSVKELLNPRFELTTDYPGNQYELGTIFEKLPKTADWFSPCSNIQVGFKGDALRKYKDIFKPLPWYAKRSVEEMPEYVKLNPANTTGEEGIFKVKSIKIFEDGIGLSIAKEPNDPSEPFEYHIHTKYFLPATESEYTAYINSKK